MDAYPLLVHLILLIRLRSVGCPTSQTWTSPTHLSDPPSRIGSTAPYPLMVLMAFELTLLRRCLSSFGLSILNLPAYSPLVKYSMETPSMWLVIRALWLPHWTIQCTTSSSMRFNISRAWGIFTTEYRRIRCFWIRPYWGTFWTIMTILDSCPTMETLPRWRMAWLTSFLLRYACIGSTFNRCTPNWKQSYCFLDNFKSPGGADDAVLQCCYTPQTSGVGKPRLIATHNAHMQTTTTLSYKPMYMPLVFIWYAM